MRLVPYINAFHPLAHVYDGFFIHSRGRSMPPIQGVGVFSVNQCMIQRIDTGGSIRFQPNLQAECELAWITARPAAPGDKKL